MQQKDELRTDMERKKKMKKFFSNMKGITCTALYKSKDKKIKFFIN